MNKLMTSIASNVTKISAKAIFKVKKFSPEILLGGGILIIAVGTVIACKKTKNAEAVINLAEEEITNIKKETEVGQLLDSECKKYIRQEKTRAVGRIISNYALPVTMIAGGIAMILASHGIMHKRQAMLLTAYNALDAAFQKYREKVLSEENGLEKDRRYLIGDDYPKDDILNENEIDDINREGLHLMHVNSPYGPYTFEFSRFTTKKWSADSLSNRNTILSAEDWANRKLRLNGFVFLNDILEYLDLDAVPWGQLVGWIRGNNEGDNYIQIMAVEDRNTMDMDNDSWKKPVFLEFNCDGAIWDKI